jgi:DNA modification methylase
MNLNLITGHTLEVLKTLPDDYYQTILTSSPFWGLRAYDTKPQIWDGDPNCEHKWDDVHPAGYRANDPGTNKDNIGSQHRQNRRSQICSKCGAYLGELGLEPTPGLFIEHLALIYNEVYRVLRPDGTFWVNIDDSYMGGASGGHADPLYAEGRNVRGSVWWNSSIPNKSLALIPQLLAVSLQRSGWVVRNTIIWHKVNSMPESADDRLTNDFEYFYLCVKSTKSQFWTHRDLSGTRKQPKPDYRWVNRITDDEVSSEPSDAKEIIICPNCLGSGIETIDVSYEMMGELVPDSFEQECSLCEGDKKIEKWKRINLWDSHDYYFDMDAIREPHRWEHVGEMRKGRDSKNGGSVKNPVRGMGNTTGSFRGFGEGGRNKRAMLSVPTKPFKGAHFATFPEELIEPMIKAGTSTAGCCPKCKAPYTRVIKLGNPIEEWKKASGADSNGEYKGQAQKEYDRARAQNASDVKRRILEGMRERKTSGWRPTCDCNAGEPVGCDVLDPFSGSGTTGKVAIENGCIYTGIDLNEKYNDMARKRLEPVLNSHIKFEMF